MIKNDTRRFIQYILGDGMALSEEATVDGVAVRIAELMRIHRLSLDRFRVVGSDGAPIATPADPKPTR